MIGWGQIAYGAVLSAIAAGLLLTLSSGRLRSTGPGPRSWLERLPVILAGGISAASAPLAWNAILRATEARSFFVDAPLVVLPASWQDTGSGIYTLALAALVLGAGPLAAEPGRRVAVSALLCGLAAFLVDVYLY